MTTAIVRHTATCLIASLATLTGLACATEGPTAPLSSYPCRVGWELRLLARDPLQDYFYDVLRPGASSDFGASLIEVSLVRVDVTLDASGTRCVEHDTFVSTPWALLGFDPFGTMSIIQPNGVTPARVRALQPGLSAVRAVFGPDTTGVGSISVVPRVASLVIAPSDTVDAGAIPVSVQVFGRDSADQPVPLFRARMSWAVLQSSTIAVALWPTVFMQEQSSPPGINARVTFPSTAAVGTARIRFRTRHATATLSVTVPPAP